MKWGYNLILGLYWILVNIAALFNKKAKQFVVGRKGQFQKLSKAFIATDKIIWFHSASLGEFEQGRPVIEAFKKEHPGLKILVTFFSPSGYEIRKNYSGADYICYLPLDYSWNAAKFLDIIKPQAIYFIKYEFWPNYINEAKRRNIPIYCFSSNFRNNQLFFKWYGGKYKNILSKFKHLFVQNQRSKELLESVGITNVTVNGDTRFDRVHQIASQTKELPVVASFKANHNIIVCGSTWPVDEDLIIEYINICVHNCKFIIAPHELHETNIEQLQRKIMKKNIRYSQANETIVTNYDVLIIDNIGMLSSIYKYGVAAYIGGGFGKGIHNILEAATFGLPVVIGPKHKKFQEAVDLIERGGVFPISNGTELNKIFDTLLYDSVSLTKASTICKNYVAENTGATSKILELTLKELAN